MSDSQQDIKITGQPTLDPQICKFETDRPLMPEGSFNCRNKEMAKGSPLLEALFEVDGIMQVHVHGSVLTIAKSNDEQWPVLGQRIGAVIREQFASGGSLISDEAANQTPDEEKIRDKIEQLFAQDINPQIAMHGGRVELADVEGSKVSVRLGGGCQGCASANMTLRMGIERAIRQVVPEVSEVVDVTDHASGHDPYFREQQ